MNIAQKIQTVELDQRVPLSDHLSYEAHALKEGLPIGRKVRSEFRFCFEQVVSEQELEKSRLQILDYIHEKSKAVIIHEVYGDVVNELRDIQIAIWEEGARFDTKISDRLDKLIKSLS